LTSRAVELRWGKMRRPGGNSPDMTAVLRRVASTIARRFRPRRIVLFGSHAEGRAGPDSDLDLLVIVSRTVASSRIRCALPDSIPIDVLVRTQREVDRRLAAGDPFFREVLGKGKVLYESRRARVG